MPSPPSSKLNKTQYFLWRGKKVTSNPDQNLDFGPTGKNPSCLVTVSGISAQPLHPPYGLCHLETFFFYRKFNFLFNSEGEGGKNFLYAEANWLATSWLVTYIGQGYCYTTCYFIVGIVYGWWWVDLLQKSRFTNHC